MLIKLSADKTVSEAAAAPQVSVQAKHYLLAIFNVPQLEKVAQEVEATIVKIMKEAVSA